jgi:ABC-2 type transport system permease protein
MKLRRVWFLFLKDLALGPRSPLLLFVLAMPALIALVLHLVFGGLAAPEPRLAIVDEGGSALAAVLDALPGVTVTRLDNREELLKSVEANDYDAGLILPAGFDRELREGLKPLLRLHFSGESYAVNRLVLAVGAIDGLRAVEGKVPPVRVDLVRVEEGDPVPLTTRFVPVIVFYAFIMAGLFVPASLLVEEKERRTLTAVLASPARIQEVIAAKGLLGLVLAFLLALASLILNGVTVRDFPGLLLVLLVAGGFWAALGNLIGIVARSSEMLFAIVKGSGAFLFAPIIFYLFPDWPQWIARLFPTWWAIDPLWQMVANDATLADVLFPLGVVAFMTLAMVPLLAFLGGRMQKHLA